MKNIKLLIISLIMCVAITQSLGQSSINSAGGEASGTGGTVSYSVGQVVYNTYDRESQGVQQPFEIFTITSVDDTEKITLNVSVYPNPTTDYLTLSIDNSNVSDMSYCLYSITGTLIETKDINDTQTIISMSYMVPSTYFLKVSQENKIVKTFKIIKK